MNKLLALLGLSVLLFSAPAFAQADGDGDGVDDSVDLCLAEDASFFDANGDGCIDPAHSTRHVEYWSLDSLPLTYVIHENGAPNITDGSDFTAVQAGFDAWPAIPGVALSATYDGTTPLADASGMDGINHVTFEDSNFLAIYGSSVLAVGITTSFTEPTDFLGSPVRPGQIVDADMIFNPNRIFSTDTAAFGPDLQSVATHEAGHLYGFAHSAVVTSTMFPALPIGTAGRTLEIEDQVVAFMGYPAAAELATATSVSGTLTDGGTALPIGGATVLAVAVATGDTLGSTYTFEDGTWQFVGLPAQDYYIGVSPLDGKFTNAVVPALINDYVADAATNTQWNPEFWDLSESATDDDADKDPVTLASAVPVTGIDIQTNTDLDPPQLVSISPDGSSAVRADAVFFVEFDETIDFDVATTTVALNKIEPGGSSPIGFALLQVSSDDVIIVDPAGLLDYSTNYELVIQAGFADRFGNGIPSDIVTPFTTEPAPPLTISTVSPKIVSSGTIAVIYGEGFDLTSAANNTVDFGGTTVAASTVNPNAISVQVPEGLVDGAIALTVSTLIETSNTIDITAVTSNDVVRGTDIDTVNLSGAPASLAMLPDAVFTYVATDVGIDVISTGFGNPDFLSLESISYANGLVDVAAAPDGNRVYAVSRVGRELLVINSDYGDVASPNSTFNTILDQLPTLGEPLGIAVDPAGERAYITTSSGQVEIWDIELGSATYHRQVGLLESTIPSLAGPIAVDRTGLRVIALAGSGEALVWDASDPLTLATEVPATTDPRDVTIDPQGTVAYLTDGSGAVSVLLLATSSISQTIAVDGSPRAMTVTPSGERGYLADRADDELPAVDLKNGSPTFRTVTSQLNAGVAPIDVAVAPSADYVVVLEETARQARVIGIGQGPEITGISPQWVNPGDVITINGSGFATWRPYLAATTTNRVYFGDTVVVPAYADPNTMFVAVPSDWAGGSIRVSFEGPAVVGLPSEYFSNPVNLPLVEQRDGNAGRDVFLYSENGYDWDDVGVVATVAAAPNGKFVIGVSLANNAYLINSDRNDADYGQIIGSIPMNSGCKPGRMVIAPDSRLAYYSGTDQEIHILDVDPASPAYLTEIGIITNTLQNTLSGPFPDLIEITPSGQLLVVSDELNDQLYFADLDPESEIYHETIVETGPLGYATGLDIHPTGLAAYFVASTGNLHVVGLDRLDETYLQQVVVVPQETSGRDIQFSPDGTYAYGVNREYAAVSDLAIETWDTANPYAPSLLDWRSLQQGSANTRSAGYISPMGSRLIVDSPGDGLTFMLRVGPTVPTFPSFEDLDNPQINGTSDIADVAWMPDGSGFWAASRGDTGISYVDLVTSFKLAPVSGQLQTGVAGQPLPAPLVYSVTDGAGGAALGTVAEVEVTSGGGTLGNGTGYQWLESDNEGKFYIDWTLGPVADTGTPGNTIEIRLNNGFSVADGVTAFSVEDPNTLPLSQVQTAPPDASADISVTTTVQVTFSRAVQAGSIDATSFGLRNQTDGSDVPVVYGFSNGNRDVSMTPISQLPPSTPFEIFSTTAILDSNGDPLTNPGATTFTTQAPPPLALTALSPPAATVGTQVVISGTGFAATAGDNAVHFGAASTVASSAGPGYVIAYVPLGATTGNLTVEANGQTSNALSFTVLVPETAPLDEIISTVDTGISVQSVAVTPDGSKAYTVSTGTNEVLPVDLATFTNLPAIAVGSAPKGVVIHPNGQTAYVTNFGSGTVSVIDVATDAVIATITVGTNPEELVASPIGDRLYVVNSLDQTLSVIDIDATSATYHTVVSSVPTTKSTKGAAIQPDGSLLFLGTSDGYIAIDLGTSSFGVVTSYSTGKSTKGAAITPDGSLLLLVTTANEVLILDISAGPSNAVVSSYSTGKNTKGAAITPDGSLLYILQEGSDEILVVELIISSSVSSSVVLTPIVVTTRVINTIPVDPDPEVVAFDPSGSGLAIVGHSNDAGQLTFLNVSSVPFGQLQAIVEVNPRTLNLGSRGRFVTGYVDLPVGVFVENIDLSTVKLNDLIPPELDKVEYEDPDQDTINTLVLKFDRKAVQEALPQGDYVPVWINGLMTDGRSFAGDDTIRTIRPQVTHPAGNEAFYPGQEIMVTWVSPEGVTVACVDLFWSPDDGTTWMEVAVGLEDTGAYAWTVPDLYTDRALMEVTIYDSCDGTHQHGDDAIGVGISQDAFFIMEQSVPVVMQSMELGVRDGAGLIEWSIADPQSVDGFHVFRSNAEDGEYTRVSDVPVTAVSTMDGVKFVFEDDSIFANRDYFYMLQEDREFGNGFDHGPYRLNWALDNALYQNRPNSFNPRTTISFSIAQDGRTKLAVYNLAGRLVDVIVDEVLRADTHEYVWNGTDRSGRSVASGVYVYRLTAPGGFAAAKKMTLVR